MKITVDSKGLFLVKRAVDNINYRLVDDYVDAPCSFEVVEKTFIEESPVIGRSEFTVEVKIPRVISGQYTVWAFASNHSPLPGKFGSIYYAEGASEEVEKFLEGISVVDCDHCGLNRTRYTTYVVEDMDRGNLLQVGSGCLAEFIGVTAKTVHALNSFKSTFADLDGYKAGEDEYIVDSILAYALNVVEQDDGIYKRGVTAQTVRDMIENEDAVPKMDVESFKTHVEGLSSTSEYVSKVHALFKQDTITPENFNMLVSSVCLAPKDYTDEYAGEVNEKVTNKLIKVEKVHTYTDYSRISGVDKNKRQLTWFKSHEGGTFFVELPVPGEEITVSSARVKKLSVFNGIKQTQLTRVRVKK